MIDGLISGRVHQKGIERIAKNGARFASIRIKTTQRDGTGLVVGVIAFSASAITALLILDAGDPVALLGDLYVGAIHDGRPAIEMTCSLVTSIYDINRKRKPMQPGAPGGDNEVL